MLLVAFVGLTGFALLVQAIVMLVAFLTMRKSIASLHSNVEEMRASIGPILHQSKETIERVAPKIESIAADIAEMTRTAKEQTARISFTTDEILARVHRQTSRVDNMVSNVVDGVEHARNVVSDSVTRPVRQITALLASAKAFITVLATGRRPEREVDMVTDQDMFV